MRNQLKSIEAKEDELSRLLMFTSCSFNMKNVQLKSLVREELLLPLVQLYELSRLLKFRSWSELVSFSQEHQLQGCYTWVPLQLRCDDGLLHILPGDSRYRNGLTGHSTHLQDCMVLP